MQGRHYLNTSKRCVRDTFGSCLQSTDHVPPDATWQWEEARLGLILIFQKNSIKDMRTWLLFGFVSFDHWRLRFLPRERGHGNLADTEWAGHLHSTAWVSWLTQGLCGWWDHRGGTIKISFLHHIGQEDVMCSTVTVVKYTVLHIWKFVRVKLKSSYHKKKICDCVWYKLSIDWL